jgi:two-component system CheB/CheR fusion protein
MTAVHDAHELDNLLQFLKRNRGFDFTGYKRSTLQRRLNKRMESVKAESYAHYLDLLEAQPDEFTQLFNTLLINVTRFFRDEEPWQVLTNSVIPPLLAAREPGAAIRVWSAGCASGEEAYSLAIVLAELMGPDAFRERVKIYATDVDEEALALARAATYTEKQVAELPAPLLERYFERADSRYTFRKDLRRCVIFGRNDLVQDAPISRIDLLACRNTLMYFNATTQAGILARFHFALADGGTLFLGRAETLLTYTSAFEPVDLKRRIFIKVPKHAKHGRPAPPSQAGDNGSGDESAARLWMQEAAFEAGTTPHVVVDRAGRLRLANERARSLFALLPTDIDRPIQDLELSYRPVELRSLIEQCHLEQGPVAVREVAWRVRAGAERWVSVELSPLLDGSGMVGGVSISFADVTREHQLRSELEENRQSLERAYEELQSTNEELETTNEELQSTVEELETTNEELQSTNEELETMNEELQSMNEELEASNDELRHRGDELNDLNAFLEGVFASLRGGVVVVDRNQHVLVWNARAEETWGLRAEEVVGKGFLGLDIGLPVEQLAGVIRGALHGVTDGEVVVNATNRRGRVMRCRVTSSPLPSANGLPRGVILVMEEAGGG